MVKVNYRLALENAQKSIARDNFFRTLSKMPPEDQMATLKDLQEKISEGVVDSE